MQLEDHTNKIYGDYLVLQRGPDYPSGGTRWWCRCKCGKEELKGIDHLKRGHIQRCLKCRRQGKENPCWKGSGDVSAGWFYNHILRCNEKGRKRYHEVTITIEEIWDLFLQQNKRCKYSNLELYFPKNSREEKQGLWTASLDRIDSSKGYIQGNIQWVHKEINIMKGSLSNQRFLELCKEISSNNYQEEAMPPPCLAGGNS